jgi:YD repeat-containing protein
VFLSAVVGTVAGAVFNDAFGQSMSIAGQLDVSPAGSADYRIPIGVPPGTGGMVPALAFEYSSHGANGILGVGWTLSGLPSIARCPGTVAQDGQDGRVDYSAGDRFCMQGQRLIAINGAYGAANTEYRTEIDGFTKIVSRGTEGTGPAWFEIKTKSGQTLEIGNTADSRILAQGKTTARAWTVNKIFDTKGNYLTVSYLVDAANGQVYPDRVDYTGNAAAGLAPYNSVRFVYEANDPRTDVPLIYHAGSLIRSTKRLSMVQTYAEAVKVNEYRFSYGYSVATGYSNLNSIALCDGANACLPATTFTYTGTNYITSPAVGGFTVNSNPATMNNQLLNYESTFSDFNGDGLQDIFWERTDAYDRTNGKRELWLSNTSGGFQRITNLMGLDDVWGTGTGTSTFKSHVGDFNGDQKADILWVQFSTAKVSNGTAAGSLVLWTSNGDGTFVVGNLASPNIVATGYEVHLGDFNSDGRTDIWWRNKSAKKRIMWMNTGGSGGTFQVTTNVMGADGTFPAGTSQQCSFVASDPTPHPDPWEFIYFLADFEGDGKDDVFWHHNTTYHDNAVNKVCANTRVGQWRKTLDGAATPFVLGTMQHRCTYNGSFPDGSNSDDVSTVCKYATAGLIPADFNGDGKTDVYWQGLDWRTIWMSTGAPPSTSSLLHFQVTDTATPDGAFNIFLNLNGQNGQSTYYTPMLFDFNADGKTDIMFSNVGNTSRYLWISKGDGTFIQLLNVANRNGVKPGTIAFVTDLNGDGKADVFWDTHDSYGRSTGKNRELWLSDGIPSDLLKTVTDGLGIVTTVTYGPLTKGGPVYAKDANATYPLLDIQGPLYVVTRVDTDDGIGGTYSMTFSYAGAKADQSGRGFLGFRQRVKTDLRTNIAEISTYRQDFPYLSVLANEEKKLGALLLNRTINTHNAVNLGGTRHFVGVSQSQTASWDLNGTAMPTTTTTYQYDAFGNPTQIVVTGSDNTVRTTTNTYDNDIVNWYLGRLKRATVTNTVIP